MATLNLHSDVPLDSSTWNILIYLVASDLLSAICLSPLFELMRYRQHSSKSIQYRTKNVFHMLKTVRLLISNRKMTAQLDAYPSTGRPLSYEPVWTVSCHSFCRQLSAQVRMTAIFSDVMLSEHTRFLCFLRILSWFLFFCGDSWRYYCMALIYNINQATIPLILKYIAVLIYGGILGIRL